MNIYDDLLEERPSDIERGSHAKTRTTHTQHAENTPMRKQSNATPQNLWEMIKAPGENTIEPPLIIQQDAMKRNNKYVRVTKDGRISMIGIKNAQNRDTKLEQQDLIELKTKNKSDLEITVSQPWKTQQEQELQKYNQIQQMLEKEQRRQEDKQTFVVHHQGTSPDGTKTLVSIRKDTSSRPDSCGSEDVDRDQTPKSLVHKKYQPN